MLAMYVRMYVPVCRPGRCFVKTAKSIVTQTMHYDDPCMCPSVAQAGVLKTLVVNAKDLDKIRMESPPTEREICVQKEDEQLVISLLHLGNDKR